MTVVQGAQFFHLTERATATMMDQKEEKNKEEEEKKENKEPNKVIVIGISGATRSGLDM